MPSAAPMAPTQGRRIRDGKEEMIPAKETSVDQSIMTGESLPVDKTTGEEVFCPCALVPATPTAIMAATGQATRRGVIIKSGEALEKMGKVTALLSMAASAEAKSEHPPGKAIQLSLALPCL